MEAIMNRSFVLTRAVLAVIGLILAGPQKASAQTISACVNSVTGLLYVVAANANCPPSSGNVTWTKTTLSTTPGVLAGAAFQCAQLSTPGQGGPIPFIASLSGVNFGSAISTTGMAPWFSFLLQTGVYQVHFSAGLSSQSNIMQINANLNETSVPAIWYPFAPNVIVGDRLISVSQPNTTLSLILVAMQQASPAPACELIITKIQ
jgi:hypothetical protein